MTLPVLAASVSRANEDHFLAAGVARHQHEDRLGLIDAREVQKIAVLPVLIVDIA